MGRNQRQSDSVDLIDDCLRLLCIEAHQEGAGTVWDLRYLQARRTRLQLCFTERVRQSRPPAETRLLRGVLSWIVQMLFKLLETGSSEQ
jgi:hypothetical protein